MNKNSILKLEIEMDKAILEAKGYSFEKSVEIICNGLHQAGLEKELVEEGHIIYKGSNSDKDFSYFGLVYNELVKQ